MLNRRRFLRALSSTAFVNGFGSRWLHTQSSPIRTAHPAFEEIPSSKSGIIFRHTAGLSDEMFLPETVGGGCAFIDYDNDGWMDIYLINSGVADFFTPKTPLRNALYRNNRDGTFTDVTEKAHVQGNAYGMGVAVGDYNRDGLPDLYVTQYPNNILYRNNGDGTFTDVTAKAGVAAPGWGTSAVWFDYDNDGQLDLFVCNFAEFDVHKNVYCGSHMANGRYYCKPNTFKPRSSWLFHNNGDGTFTDVSRESGVAQALGKAWGVVAADLNNDGEMDLFVGNDTAPNFLFMNRGKGHFEEVGAISGVALSPFGVARSGMGVDAADYDQDGWLDLFVANVDHEAYSLYRNNKDETFEDVSNAFGIASVTSMMSGWGLKFFDYNNDGNLDLILANGHPDLLIAKHTQGVRYEEPLLLFENNGKAWRDVSSISGSVFSKVFAARGLAIGDFDNDGSVDVLIGVNDGAPVLLRNNAGRQNNWLGIKLIGKKSNIDAIGAKIIYQAGNMRRTVTKVGGGSYLSSHDPRIVLGLGKETQLDSLEIHWPGSLTSVTKISKPMINSYMTVIEG